MFMNKDKAFTGYTNTNATRTTGIFAIKCSVNYPSFSWIGMSHLRDLTSCLYFFLLHFLNIWVELSKCETPSAVCGLMFPTSHQLGARGVKNKFSFWRNGPFLKNKKYRFN